MSTEFRVWSIVEGALEDDETYRTAEIRNRMAEQITQACREGCPATWEVWTADVSAGCSVGEFAGEEGVLFASSEDE